MPDLDLVTRLRAAGCVFAEDEARLLIEQARTPDELARLVARRVAGEPLEYILGWVQFAGLRVAVEAGVFVPRRRSEFLVRQAAARARAGDVVVDLCCGCGAIGSALSAAVSGIELYAADIDPAAVRCARRNLGERVQEGDLFAALSPALRGRVAVVTVNAPYVPTEALATMPAEARLYEPRVALDGGPDGLHVLRRVIDDAPNWLAPGAHLLVESSRAQAPALVAAMADAGLAGEVATWDEPTATVVIGSYPPRIRVQTEQHLTAPETRPT